MPKGCVLGRFFLLGRGKWASAHRLSFQRAGRYLSFLCAFCSSCSPHSSPATTTSLPAAIKTQELIYSYGLSRNTTCAPYLERRLNSILDRSAPRFSINLLATEIPFALSPGDTTILLSVGLIRRLTTEGEALFLLTHEVAHYQLGHIEKMNAPDPPGVEARLDFEFSADQYAQHRLSQGGYDPQSGVRALIAVYSYGGVPTGDPAYPSLNERLVRLVQAEWHRADPDTVQGSQAYRAACRLK